MNELNIEFKVRAAQRGDNTMAMNELIDELVPYVGRICRGIARERGDDAMQESLIAILKSIRQLRQPEKLRPWARRIAVREAIRIARSEPRHLALDDAHVVVRSVSALELHDVLDRLSPEQRAALVLREIEGLNEHEAAQVLGVAIGTVKSRFHRAKARFREAWEE